MTDIVNRLRNEIEAAQHPTDKVIAEAADEIQRLREALKYCREVAVDGQDIMPIIDRALNEEVSRPRAACTAGTLDTPALKKWAWDACNGWADLVPAEKEGDEPRRAPWNFEKRMNRADKLAAWLLTPPESST